MNDLVEINLGSSGVGVTTNYLPVSYSVLLSPQYAQISLPSVLTSDELAFDASTAAWVLQAAKKLEALGRLRQNWDSYGGLPISPNARKITFDALGWLKNQDLPTPAVVLGSAGTVHLEWRKHGKELEIGFDGRGILEYCKVDGRGRAEEGEADREARQRLIQLAEWLRSSD